MPIVADAAVAVRADMSKFNAELATTGKKASGLGGLLSSALSPKNLLIGGGIALAAAPVLDFLGGAVDAASNLNETISKTGQIFGQEALPGLEEWASTAAETFGQSKQGALDAASTFATFGKSAGLAGDDLSGFSTNLTELASDLGSFYNTSPEDAVLAIGAALRGESEPIRRYGVLLNEATLKQKAMELGIIRTTTEALTPQQRVLAAQAEILAQTSDAQGDFARTSDGLANTQRTNAAKWDDAMAKIGAALLPVATQIASFAGDVIPLLADGIAFLLTPIAALFDALKTGGQLLDNFAMDSGEMGIAVHDLADRANVDFQTMKDAIKTNMEESGMSFDEAKDKAAEDFGLITQSQDELVAASGTAWDTYQSQIASSGDAAANAVRGFQGTILEEMEQGRVRVVDIALRLPGEIAQALEDGRDSVTQASLALTDAIEEEIAPADEIARLQGELTGSALAQGLNSKDPIVRARAQAYRQAIYDRIATLNGSAYGWGAGVGTSYARGLASAQSYVNDKANQIKYGVQHILEFAGSPAYTHSREIGENVALSWADGLARGFKGLDMPSLVPALSGVAAPMASAAVGVGLGNTYIVNVNGVERRVSNAEEVIAELEALGAFGEGRLS